VKRETELRRQRGSLETLGEAVDAMRSLAAHRVRASRSGLSPARDYRRGIDRLTASLHLVQQVVVPDRPAWLLVAADLGLCDGYNTQLTAALLDQTHQPSADPVYVVGRRPLALLRRAGIDPRRTYEAATGAAGLTTLLLSLADDVLGDYLGGAFTSLHVVSARFDGVGAFTPVVSSVLPIEPAGASGGAEPGVAATPYSTPAHLARVAVREYLYSTLFGLLLDALAAEYGARLVATESAGEWLDSRVADLDRRIASVRREAATQEVLDVAAGVRQRRRHEAQ